MPTFKGRVVKVIYNNDSFYIFAMKAGNQNLKCKGTFLGVEVRPQMTLTVEGEWESSKYGNTLDVKRIEEEEPSDIDGITRYLSANVKGVGWATATKIAEQFGEDTVSILVKKPIRIMECDFLTDGQKEEIHKALSTNKGKRDISLFLMKFDVSAHVIERIFKKFGTDAVTILMRDPYQLMGIQGMGFKRADDIAARMGIDKRSPIRVRAVIHHILEDVGGSEGHLYLPKELLRTKALKMLGGVPARIYRECLESLEEDGKVVVEEEKCYSQRHYHNEVDSAMLLCDMMLPVHRDFDLVEFIRQYEATHSTPQKPFELTEEQITAIETAVLNKVMVITGLPGTGKTTVLKAIVDMFENFVPHVALMAPTGIASKRLSEATGRVASTIHRGLGCRGTTWECNQHTPLADQAVIVDEFSMVDMSLMRRLLQGIRPDASLILVGDVAQLPSVGPGNVLSELIKSGVIPVVQLTTIHRQEEASDIILNAHRIQRGEDLVIDNAGPSDFKLIHSQEEELLLSRLLLTAKALQDRGLQFQCLSPRHAGTLGVQNLNEQLRDVLNVDTGQDSVSLKVKDFRSGDRVMVTRNNYNLKVFNGDIGTIISINNKKKRINFLIDGNKETTAFTFGETLSDLVLSYCVTIHKSQGSEWDIVLMPMIKKFSIQLVRNLLYTGITRARSKVLIFGQAEALNRAVRNNKVTLRNTIFAERLRNIID